MAKRTAPPLEMPRLTVKLSANRQVVIPKRLCEELALQAGALLEATVTDGRVVFTPQTLVDTRVIEEVRSESGLPAALKAALRP